MIARLVGRLAQKSPEALVVDVHGVGYRVMVSLTAFAALPEQGAEVELAIHTHLRETALELFGFVSPDERALFAALITVSGIGPRMALNILSGLPAADLRAPRHGAGAADAEAVSALVNLGYRQPEAERAVRAATAAGAKELAEVIRRALQKLSG